MKKIDIKDITLRLFEVRPDDAYTADEILERFRRWNVEAFRCRRGEICFKAGAPATDFLVIVSGTLHVKMPNELGEDILVRVARPCEYVGLPLIYTGEKKYSFDVVAASAAEIALFKVDEVRKWRTDPASQPLFDHIGRLMGGVIRESQMRAMIMSGRDIAERLRRYLAVRMEQEGSRTIAIQGTSADLADYLGVNKCALCRSIARMRDEGKVEFSHGVFTVL